MAEKNYSGARAAIEKVAQRFRLGPLACACVMTEEARYHLRKALEENGFVELGFQMYDGQCISVEMALLQIEIAESEAVAAP
ncbi:MAG: hypothetical protein QY311_01315 [Candidatus Paceibacterota bacterium]|nr:MAG: hypothetical protein QY311_01315 [Candidatus Paceibacterota bacterium]